MHNAPGRRSFQTQLAHLTVPEQLGGSADGSIVVKALNDRNPGLAADFVDPRRKQRKEVMDMNDVGPKLSDRLSHRRDADRIFHGTKRGQRLIKERRNVVVRDKQRIDLVARGCEQFHFAFKNAVFAAALAVSVMRDEYLHGERVNLAAQLSSDETRYGISIPKKIVARRYAWSIARSRVNFCAMKLRRVLPSMDSKATDDGDFILAGALQ